MFRVQLDRLDDQVKSVHAVDFARHAVSSIGAEAETFGEVQQAIHTPGIGVEHEKHCARGIFRPRDQEQMIGAEVEHGKATKEREWKTPARLGSADVGLTGGLLRTDYRHSAAPGRGQPTRPADQDSCWPCAGCRHPGERFQSSRRVGRR